LAGILNASAAMDGRLSRFAHRSLRFAALSARERERLAGHAFALLLVAGIACVRSVIGLTGHHVPFTLYIIAVAAAAARGGAAPAIVAILASMLVASIASPVGFDGSARVLFAVESLGLTAVIASVSARVRSAREHLASAQITIGRLQARDQHRRLLEAALRHVEDTVTDTAIVVLDANGIITEWRSSAERLYGYSAEEAIGMSASVLLAKSERHEFLDLLRNAQDRGTVHGSGAYRRCDGRQIDAEFDLQHFRDIDVRSYTLMVHDMARSREWDAYRDAASRAQRALQRAVDEMKQQLTALENVIDPSLNPLEGPAAVGELLERLRSAMEADGAALVRGGRGSAWATAAGGMQPAEGPPSARPVSRPLTPGRVTLVHNDRQRVAQTTALRWPGDVSSLMTVPVVYNGQVWSTIEVVSQRPKRATDWDVALMRITADRLAVVVVQEHVAVSRRLFAAM
jgi:PAS domain S-box-containing protein